MNYDEKKNLQSRLFEVLADYHNFGEVQDGKEKILRLLEEGASVRDSYDIQPMSPLGYAALYGLEEPFKVLINSEMMDGLHLNDLDKMNSTLLTHALSSGNKNIVLELLKHDEVDVNKPSGGFGNYPIQDAVKKLDLLGQEVIDILLSKGADANSLFRGGDNYMEKRYIDAEGNVSELLKSLIQESSTKLSSDSAWFIYNDMSRLKFPKAIKELTELGIFDVSPSSGKGPISVLKAISLKDLDMADYLVRQGADISECGPVLSSISTIPRSSNLIKLLISKGVDIEVKNAIGLTPLQELMAIRNQQPEGNKSKDLEENIGILIRSGANLDVKREDNGRTPLTVAIVKKDQKVLEMIMNKGSAKWNVQDVNGDTSLHLLVNGGWLPEMIQKAVDAGADLNIANNKGKTPLDIAKSHNHLGVVEVLEKAKEIQFLQEKANSHKSWKRSSFQLRGSELQADNLSQKAEESLGEKLSKVNTPSNSALEAASLGSAIAVMGCIALKKLVKKFGKEGSPSKQDKSR